MKFRMTTKPTSFPFFRNTDKRFERIPAMGSSLRTVSLKIRAARNLRDFQLDSENRRGCDRCDRESARRFSAKPFPIRRSSVAVC